MEAGFVIIRAEDFTVGYLIQEFAAPSVYLLWTLIVVAYEWNGSWQACVSCGRTVSSRLAKLNLALMDLVVYLLTVWASARLYRYASGFTFFRFYMSVIRQSLI